MSESEPLSRDLGKIAQEVLLDIVEKHYESQSDMAKQLGVRQTTLNRLARTGKGELRTVTEICQRDGKYFNALIVRLAGEATEDPSWERVASNLRAILGLPEAWDIVDSLQTLAITESLPRIVKWLRETANLAQESHTKGRAHPLEIVNGEKKPTKTGA